MEEIIDRIMQIENKAQSIIHDAKEASGELETRIMRDIERMNRDIEQKAEEKGKSLKEQSMTEMQKKIDSITEQSVKAAAALQEKYRQNKDKWASEIADRVINA